LTIDHLPHLYLILLQNNLSSQNCSIFLTSFSPLIFLPAVERPLVPPKGDFLLPSPKPLFPFSFPCGESAAGDRGWKGWGWGFYATEVVLFFNEVKMRFYSLITNH